MPSFLYHFLKNKTLLSLIAVMMVTSISFENYTDKRLVYLFGNEHRTLVVRQQIQLLDSSIAGVKERDLEIVVVKAGNKLYQQYKVPNNKFCIILIGKDGGEKFRSYRIIEPEKLFLLIDGMPMRKSEMRAQN